MAFNLKICWFLLVFIIVAACSQESAINNNSNSLEKRSNKKTALDDGSTTENMPINLCTYDVTDGLYFVAFAQSSFIITPKFNGDFGTETFYVGGLDCLSLPTSGWTCDSNGNYTGSCLFTIITSHPCGTGEIFLVEEDIEYTVTPNVNGLNPCFGESFSFTIESGCEDRQFVRYCSNECFSIQCQAVDCLPVTIN